MQEDNSDGKSEEEVSIDLSKLAFWKKKGNEEKKEGKNEESKKEEPGKENRANASKKSSTITAVTNAADSDKGDEEIDVDFSKFTSFFKKSKDKSGSDSGQKAEADESEGAEESAEVQLNLNPKKIWEFIVKYRAFFIILFAVLVMFNFRNFPNELPVTDDWARQSVYNYYKGQVAGQISQQYPNLPDANRNTLIEDQFRNYYNQNKAGVEQQVTQTSQYFKQHLKDDKGYTYLADIDSYFWLRQAENVLKRGHVGDRVKDGGEWDDFMTAPVGTATLDTLYPFAEAYLYRILSIFNSKISTMHVAFLTPWFFSIFAIIAAFFITRRIAGDFGGALAAVYIGIHPFVLTRTFGSDNDIVNIVFPLVTLWLFLEAFEATETKKRIALSAATGLLFGFYSFAWGGWWFVLDFIIGTIVIYFVYLIITHYKNLRKPKEFFEKTGIKEIFVLLVVLISSTILFTALISKQPFIIKETIKGPLGFLSIKKATQNTIWPNVYTTVAELNPADFNQVISSLGTKFLFYFSLLGAVLMFFKKDARGHRDVKFIILFTIWYSAIVYASFSGVRFILMVVPVYVIGVGLAAGLIQQWASSWIAKSFHINKIVVTIVLMLGLSLIMMQPLQVAYGASRSELPIINDAWWNALTKIKQESNPDAIINSWWDFGHHFKYIAQRRVTFDGASQSTPMAHWIGKVLLTDDENEAAGILRMLDCGSQESSRLLEEEFNDSLKAVSLLQNIVKMNKEQARAHLIKNKVKTDVAEEVLKLTHCEPPENFFITSEDMIGKSGVWGHFGSWNFSRSEIANTIRGKDKESAVNNLLNRGLASSKIEAEKLYFEVSSLPDENAINAWIAPWPGYQSGLMGCSGREKDVLLCGQGVLINTTSNIASIATQEGFKYPAVYVYPDAENVIVEQRTDNTVGIGITLVPSGTNEFQVLISSPEIAKSMFNRLFFLRAHGLSYFKPFTFERSITGSQIYVWKVDWEGKEKNNVFVVQAKNQTTNQTNQAMNQTSNNEPDTATDTTAESIDLEQVDSSANDSEISAVLNEMDAAG